MEGFEPKVVTCSSSNGNDAIGDISISKGRSS